MDPELATTIEVMEALGGTKAVAELTGRTYGAAFNWRSFSRFPSNTFVVMRKALRERGMDAPPSLWGMTEAAESQAAS